MDRQELIHKFCLCRKRSKECNKSDMCCRG